MNVYSGGGAGGIQAPLGMGNTGSRVCLVEKSPSMGGRMVQHGEAFCGKRAMCVSAPKMTPGRQHSKVELSGHSARDPHISVDRMGQAAP